MGLLGRLLVQMGVVCKGVCKTMTRWGKLPVTLMQELKKSVVQAQPVLD